MAMFSRDVYNLVKPVYFTSLCNIVYSEKDPSKKEKLIELLNEFDKINMLHELKDSYVTIIEKMYEIKYSNN